VHAPGVDEAHNGVARVVMDGAVLRARGIGRAEP
jgi:hypothetical protein